jgi:YD repeat-containing protein
MIANQIGDAANPALAQVPESLSYSYNEEGARQTLTCGGSRCLSLSYQYDRLNRPSAITAQNILSKQLQYDPLSRLTVVSGGAGSRSAHAYDDASQLLTIAHTIAGTPVAPLAYAYDAIGNRTSLTDRVGLHQYGYDALSRLLSADHPSTHPFADEAFTYDPVGNRVTSHLSAAHQHNAANRLLSDDDFTYTYDANGNRATKTDKVTAEVTTYHYDVENQLTGVDLPSGQPVRYRYDGLSRRSGTGTDF